MPIIYTAITYERIASEDLKFVCAEVMRSYFIKIEKCKVAIRHIDIVNSAILHKCLMYIYIIYIYFT